MLKCFFKGSKLNTKVSYLIKKNFTEPTKDVIYDQNKATLSKIKINLTREIDMLPNKRDRNYSLIFKEIQDLFNYYDKEKDPECFKMINEKLVHFLEKNVQRFNYNEMLMIFTKLADFRLGSRSAFVTFQYSVDKTLRREMSLKPGFKEEEQFTRLLYNYYNKVTNISMIEKENLNYVLNYFANFSNSLLGEKAKENINNLYDFLWLTSMAMASIVQKRIDYAYPNFPYVDNVSKILDEDGGRSLIKILNFTNKVIKHEKKSELSKNFNSKLRLYIALNYFQMEGISLPDNLNEFINSMRPLVKMNIGEGVKNSKLEDTFENILSSHKIPFEKEKKVEMFSIDYFVKPFFCIEVNGPTHYFNQYLIGKDLLKKRILTLLNYQYIAVSHNQLELTDSQGRKKINEVLVKEIIDRLSKAEDLMKIEEKFQEMKKLNEEKLFQDIIQEEKKKIADSSYLF